MNSGHEERHLTSFIQRLEPKGSTAPAGASSRSMKCPSMSDVGRHSLWLAVRPGPMRRASVTGQWNRQVRSIIIQP